MYQIKNLILTDFVLMHINKNSVEILDSVF